MSAIKRGPAAEAISFALIPALIPGQAVRIRNASSDLDGKRAAVTDGIEVLLQGADAPVTVRRSWLERE